MIGHYLMSALRNFRRDPLSAAIKLGALALGLACLLTAHVIGDYFRQTDRQWARADRIYVVAEEIRRPGAAWESSYNGTSPALAKYLRLDFPELETVARLYQAGLTVSRPGADAAWRGRFADPEFLDIFDLDMVAGEARLDRPRIVVISDRAALSLFGDENPVGQALSLTMGAMPIPLDVTVGGVFRELPANSHLGAAGLTTLDVLAPMDAWRDLYTTAMPGAEVWWEQDNFVAMNFNTYAVLPADGSLTAEGLNRQLPAFTERRAPPGPLGIRFHAEPVRGISEDLFNQFSGLPRGISAVSGLYALGLLTLAVGCINFANLSAAQAGLRAREIGLRKTVGASRRQVGTQMLVESALLVGTALVLVTPLSSLIATAISSRLILPIPTPGPDRLDYWAGVAAIAAAVALAAGVYPSLILANLRPLLSLRMTGMRGRARAVRGLLISVQFAVAAFLAVMVLVMLSQQEAVRRAILQPEADPKVFVALPRDRIALNGSEQDTLAALHSRLLTSPAVTAVTFLQQPPLLADPYWTAEFAQSLDPGARRFTGQGRRIYYDYFEVSGARLVAGRAFSREYDDTRSAIVDVETARLMGYAPQDALGQPVYRTASQQQMAGGDTGPAPEFTIVGVVDRELLILRAAGPTNNVYVLDQTGMYYALARLSRTAVDAGLAHVRGVFGQYGVAAQPAFLDQYFAGNYRMLAVMAVVFIVLSAIALAIAAMGLFGMASFVVQRRLREIGVRKTLGASGARVLGLMLWDFSRPVIVANVIAWPFAYIAARAYLELFVTRIALTPLPFLGALGVSLLIAWIAVGAHAVRAASVKPALVLKYE